MSSMITRRHLFARGATGLGAVAMSHLFAGEDGPRKPHFAPRAKRIVYLFQSGGPSQLDLFDYKPLLQKQTGRSCQRVFGLVSG